MAKGRDKNYVSVWFWLFSFFVVLLPCIGFVMILIWAFVGENESRKNYFRAMILWGVLMLLFWGLIMLLGFGTAVLDVIRDLINVPPPPGPPPTQA